MKKGFLIALFSIVISLAPGCNGDNSNSSYASILIYNKQEFIGKGIVSSDTYDSLQKVGIVSKKVAIDQYPVDDFSSNSIAEGTEIYKIDEKTLLAKVQDKRYNVFELRK